MQEKLKKIIRMRKGMLITYSPDKPQSGVSLSYCLYQLDYLRGHEIVYRVSWMKTVQPEVFIDGNIACWVQIS